MKKVLKRQVMAALAVTALLGAVCPAVQVEYSASVTPVGGEMVSASESESVVAAEAGKTTFNGGSANASIYGGGNAVAKTDSGAGDTIKPIYEAHITTAGADINVDKASAGNPDYGVLGDFAVLGGGYAQANNWAKASSAMSDTVNININAEVSGMVVGNGLALETGKASDDNGGTVGLTGLATVSAVDTNINMQSGTVAGIIGGGVALDDTEAQNTNASAMTSGTASVNVTGGTVSSLKINGITPPGDKKPGFENGAYQDGINAAAGNAAIVAGGIALGGGAEADVANAVVNINGGTVNGAIYGGGAAAYGYTETDGTKGSHVGTSTINLNGGIVKGNVYAGGAAATKDSAGNNVYTGYDKATATVDKAVINLAGTTVDGILYGQGTLDKQVSDAENVKVGTSTLNLIGVNTLTPAIAGSKIQNFTNVVATAGSETVIGEGFTTDSAALISGGKVTVEDGARLNIKALTTAEKAYKIAEDTDAGSTFWSNDALIYDRTSYYAEGTVGDSESGFTVQYSKLDTTNKTQIENAANSMAAALGARSLLGMFLEGMSNNWTNFNKAAKEYMQDWSTTENAAAGQKGMLIGEDAAVTGNTVSIARDMADNVMQRLSFTDDYVQDAGWVNENGGIWAKYIHRTYDTDAMGSSMGGIHSSTDYDGAIVGVDFGKSGKFQSGVAFHYGSGDGHGLVSRNDYDAWGITMYGSMKDEAAGTNLMADIGWMTSDNDIDGTVEGKSMSADRDVDAWTIGLRGEKEYVFGRNQLVPYVGLRYMSVNPGRYTAYYNGQAAFNYDADNQNLWMLPIGVSFRNETVTAGGWRITPKLDLSYIWAFGDTDTDMTVNAGAYSDSLYYDVMDDSSWLASLGVEASKDVWSFGLGYGYQKGDDEKNRTWFVNASYAF